MQSQQPVMKFEFDLQADEFYLELTDANVEEIGTAAPELTLAGALHETRYLQLLR